MRTEYWRLVHELMERGWYRRGPESAEDAERQWWRFRFGHLTDRHPCEAVRILAADERSAMEMLLTRLRQQPAN
jgi:hypothetical protein